MKRVMILILAVVALAACEVQQAAQDPDRVPTEIELTRIANEMPDGEIKVTVQAEAIRRYVAAQEALGTAEAARALANRHILAMTAEAGATTSALSARATTQALDASLTRQAQDYYTEQTRQAGYALATSDARAAQATAISQQATATAQQAIAHVTATVVAQATADAQRRATATMQAAVDRSELTRVASVAMAAQATAQAIARDNEIAENRQALTTFGGWSVLAIFLAGLVGMIVYLAPVIKARAQVVRRKHDETEPLVVTLERVTLPLRAMFPVVDHDNPLLPSPQMQDRTTARAQLANVVSAARGSGRRRRAARPGATRPASQAGRGVIEVIEPDQVRPWIDDARGQLIEGGVS